MDFSHALHIPNGLADPVFWVLIALILFIMILFFLNIHKKIAHSLDERSKKIAHELEEARKLREQAQELLASYQRRQREAEKEAQGIVEQARKEADRLAETLKISTRQRMEKRAEMAETKIAYAEQEAICQIKNIAADLAVNSIEKLFQKNQTKVFQKEFIKQGLEDLSNKLN